MVNVLIVSRVFSLATKAAIALLSIPPLKKTPIGTSLLICNFDDSTMIVSNLEVAS